MAAIRVRDVSVVVLACALTAQWPAAGGEPVSARVPLRPAQFGVHSRYPFAHPRGAYRYPFNYPYYRYSPRHYPFGNGPYGPYGSNYGGYTGNAYDSGVYGAMPAPYGIRPRGDAPPPDEDAPAPPPGAPPAHPPAFVPPPRPRQVPQPDAVDDVTSSIHARPLPDAGQVYGEPVPYSGGSPFNPSYGGGQLYRWFPNSYFRNDLWFGSNHIQGF